MREPQSNKQHLDILLGPSQAGATGGHRAIAQSNSTDISGNLFRYTAPEELLSLEQQWTLILDDEIANSLFHFKNKNRWYQRGSPAHIIVFNDRRTTDHVLFELQMQSLRSTETTELSQT
ncbi:hypothetical protein HID58_004735 [Brassica napus]|uniref:Uncharacterized protein n=1 Tax=Brassica napus TaxID=3708 RepID=A0ABQ8E6L7_BRANA|nr:hypothetical protein HID58_004735 [Brassica napus]